MKNLVDERAVNWEGCGYFFSSRKTRGGVLSLIILSSWVVCVSKLLSTASGGHWALGLGRHNQASSSEGKYGSVEFSYSIALPSISTTPILANDLAYDEQDLFIHIDSKVGYDKGSNPGMCTLEVNHRGFAVEDVVASDMGACALNSSEAERIKTSLSEHMPAIENGGLSVTASAATHLSSSSAAQFDTAISSNEQEEGYTTRMTISTTPSSRSSENFDLIKRFSFRAEEKVDGNGAEGGKEEDLSFSSKQLIIDNSFTFVKQGEGATEAATLCSTGINAESIFTGDFLSIVGDDKRGDTDACSKVVYAEAPLIQVFSILPMNFVENSSSNFEQDEGAKIAATLFWTRSNAKRILTGGTTSNVGNATSSAHRKAVNSAALPAAAKIFIVVDAHQPCHKQDKNSGSDAHVGSYISKHNKVKTFYGTHVQNILGKLVFSSEDGVANQVHAEAGGDFLDSNDAACCPTIIKALLSSTGNSASTIIAAAVHLLLASAQCDAAFSCDGGDEGGVERGPCHSNWCDTGFGRSKKKSAGSNASRDLCYDGCYYDLIICGNISEESCFKKYFIFEGATTIANKNIDALLRLKTGEIRMTIIDVVLVAILGALCSSVGRVYMDVPLSWVGGGGYNAEMTVPYSILGEGGSFTAFESYSIGRTFDSKQVANRGGVGGPEKEFLRIVINSIVLLYAILLVGGVASACVQSKRKLRSKVQVGGRSSKGRLLAGLCLLASAMAASEVSSAAGEMPQRGGQGESSGAGGITAGRKLTKWSVAPTLAPTPEPTPAPTVTPVFSLSGTNTGQCSVSGLCFSSLNYTNNEDCTFTASKDGYLTVQEFKTEEYIDVLTLGGSKYSNTSTPHGVQVQAGQAFTRTSNGKTTYSGFKVCLWLGEVHTLIEANEHSVIGMTELFNKVSNAAKFAKNTGNSIMASGHTAVMAVGEYKCSEGTCAGPQGVGTMLRTDELYGEVRCVNDNAECVVNGENSRRGMVVWGTGIDKLSIRATTFQNGQIAGYGGGLQIGWGAKVDVNICVFTNCNSIDSINGCGGGAIEVSNLGGGTLNVYGTNFIGNKAESGLGNDIYIGLMGTITIHNTCPSPYSSFPPSQGSALDTAGMIGGSLFSYTNCIDASKNLISNMNNLFNKVSNSRCESCSTGNSTLDAGSTAVMDVREYKCSEGKCANIESMLFIEEWYGLLKCFRDDASCILDGENARRGIKVYGTKSSTSANTLTIQAVTFKNGEADNGGGIYIGDQATADIHLCVFLKCRSTNTNSFGGGGAIYSIQSVVNIYGTSFTSNSALNAGDDIYGASGITTIHQTCPSPYTSNTPIKGNELRIKGAVEGSKFSYSCCITETECSNNSEREDTALIGGLVGGTLVLLFGLLVFYLRSVARKKRKLQRIETDREQVLTMEDKVIFEFKTKINYQRAMLLYEFIDMFTDVGKPIFLFLTYQASKANQKLTAVDIFFAPNGSNYTANHTSTSNIDNSVNIQEEESLSDVCANPAFVKGSAFLADDCSGSVDNRLWLVVVCAIIAFGALYNAITAIPLRNRVLKHLLSVVNGGALKLYAQALYGHEEGAENANAVNIGEENLLLRLDKAVLDITMEKLNSRSFKLEDVPSLLVFLLEVVIYPNEINWVSVVSAIISAILIGKKSNSEFKMKQLIAEKGKIEEQIASLEEMGSRRNNSRQEGRRGTQQEGSMKMIAAVLGNDKAREIEEAEKKVVEKKKERRKSLRLSTVENNEESGGNEGIDEGLEMGDVADLTDKEAMKAKIQLLRKEIDEQAKKIEEQAKENTEKDEKIIKLAQQISELTYKQETEKAEKEVEASERRANFVETMHSDLSLVN